MRTHLVAWPAVFIIYLSLAGSSVQALCGDGIIDANEACDDGNTNGTGWCSPDCSDVTGPFQQLYALGTNGTVYVVDVVTQQIIASIPGVSVGFAGETALRAAPDGTFVATLGADANLEQSLVIIDTATNTIGATIDLAMVSASRVNVDALVVSPDSAIAYVISSHDQVIAAIDIHTRTVLRLYDWSDLPAPCVLYPFRIGLAISNDGGVIHAVDEFGNVLSIESSTGAIQCGAFDSRDGSIETEYPVLVVSHDDRGLLSVFDYTGTWLSRLSIPSRRPFPIYDENLAGYTLQLTCDGKSLYSWTLNQEDQEWRLLELDPTTLSYVGSGHTIHTAQHVAGPNTDGPTFTELSRDGATMFWGSEYAEAITWADVTTGNMTSIPVPVSISGIGLLTLPERTGELCAAAPRPDCVEGFHSASLLVNESHLGREKLIAKLKGGPDLQQPDLGNPIRPPCGTTKYAVCLYADSGTLAGVLQVARAGHRCSDDTTMCWHSLGGDSPEGKGYAYKDTDGSSDGILKLHLRSTDAQILLKAGNNAARGNAHLPAGIAARLSSSTQPTMQLVTSDSRCFSAQLGNVRKATNLVFKARN